ATVAAHRTPRRHDGCAGWRRCLHRHGTAWNLALDWQQNWYGQKTEDYSSQEVVIDSRVYRSLENQPVTVRLSLGLTLLENAPPLVVPAHQQRFSVEGNRCEDQLPH